MDAAKSSLDQYRKSASLSDLVATIEDIDGAPQIERLSRVTAALEGLHRALRAALQQRQTMHARVLELK